MKKVIKIKILDLFSGIGGFSLGLERAGMETVAFCEIEEFPRKVLKKHWPDIPIYEDVRYVTKQRLDADGIRPDIICGGFPCQDISVAGNQKGITGERSGLWGELCRIISEVRPKYAIVENVTALISGEQGRWFQRVLGDLAEIGYDCEWHCISASELGAHHHRDRVWIICYPQYTGWNASEIRESNQAGNGSDATRQKSTGEFARPSDAEILADSESERVQRCWSGGKQKSQPHGRPKLSLRLSEKSKPAYWKTEPKLGRVADGIPDRSHRIKCLGNAVVPQIVELLGRAIVEVEREN